MITKLEIKNFRCFEDFVFDGIRPVTLIAGENNVGKSALLESVCLFHGRYTPDVFDLLNYFRGVDRTPLTPEMLWESLFLNNDSTKSIVLAINSKSSKQTLTLCKDNSKSISTSFYSQASRKPQRGFPPLKAIYESNDIKDEFYYTLTQNSVSISDNDLRTGEIPRT